MNVKYVYLSFYTGYKGPFILFFAVSENKDDFLPCSSKSKLSTFELAILPPVLKSIIKVILEGHRVDCALCSAMPCCSAECSEVNYSTENCTSLK